ncbi:MAG: hypothetical protein K0R30_2877 [Ornithinibacter sp.]|nr:hypothetical protein [Ornithinibacter sp.]
MSTAATTRVPPSRVLLVLSVVSVDLVGRTRQVRRRGSLVEAVKVSGGDWPCDIGRMHQPGRDLVVDVRGRVHVEVVHPRGRSRVDDLRETR